MAEIERVASLDTWMLSIYLTGLGLIRFRIKASELQGLQDVLRGSKMCVTGS